MSINPNLQDVANEFMADRSAMPMVLVQCIRATKARCDEEGRLASDLRSFDRKNWRGLTQKAALEQSYIHDDKYHMLCEMLGDQTHLTDFLTDRSECGCPEVYAKLDHETMGDRIGPPWITICQNPACPGDS